MPTRFAFSTTAFKPLEPDFDPFTNQEWVKILKGHLMTICSSGRRVQKIVVTLDINTVNTMIHVPKDIPDNNLLVEPCECVLRNKTRLGWMTKDGFIFQ